MGAVSGSGLEIPPLEFRATPVGDVTESGPRLTRKGKGDGSTSSRWRTSFDPERKREIANRSPHPLNPASSAPRDGKALIEARRSGPLPRAHVSEASRVSLAAGQRRGPFFPKHRRRKRKRPAPAPSLDPRGNSGPRWAGGGAGRRSEKQVGSLNSRSVEKHARGRPALPLAESVHRSPRGLPRWGPREPGAGDTAAAKPRRPPPTLRRSRPRPNLARSGKMQRRRKPSIRGPPRQATESSA